MTQFCMRAIQSTFNVSTRATSLNNSMVFPCAMMKWSLFGHSYWLFFSRLLHLLNLCPGWGVIANYFVLNLWIWKIKPLVKYQIIMSIVFNYCESHTLVYKLCLFFGFLTSSSTTSLNRGLAPRQSVWQFYMLSLMRQGWETMTFVSAYWDRTDYSYLAAILCLV